RRGDPMTGTAIPRRSLLGGALGLMLSGTGRDAHAGGGDALPPVLYVSHGAPLFADGDPTRVKELPDLGASLSKPAGSVLMTPHHGSRHLELGATGRGFAMYNLPGPMKRRLPQNLEYPTPPSDAIAKRIEGLLAGGASIPRGQRRGFDHTTWMPLLCLF